VIKNDNNAVVQVFDLEIYSVNLTRHFDQSLILYTFKHEICFVQLLLWSCGTSWFHCLWYNYSRSLLLVLTWNYFNVRSVSWFVAGCWIISSSIHKRCLFVKFWCLFCCLIRHKSTLKNLNIFIFIYNMWIFLYFFVFFVPSYRNFDDRKQHHEKYANNDKWKNQNCDKGS